MFTRKVLDIIIVLNNFMLYNIIFLQHQALPVVHIDFTQPKMEKSSKSNQEPKQMDITPPSETEKAEFWENLRKVSPKSVVLSACYKDESLKSDYQMRYPTVPGLPPTLMSLGRRKYRDMDTEKLMQACEDVFYKLCVTDKESKFLYHSTVLQSKIASMFGFIMTV